MGWECLTTECEIINGNWNNQGIPYYSISEDVSNIHKSFFDFVMNLSPGLIVFLVVITFLIIITYIFINVSRVIKNVN